MTAANLLRGYGETANPEFVQRLARYPPQPMVRQTRAVLDAYRAKGGQVREEVLPSVGHSPHLEAPEAFRSLLLGFLEGR